MTREQIEAILKAAQAKQDRDGNHQLPEGGSATVHVAHEGASLAFPKTDSIRFEGEVMYAKSARQSVAVIAADVFAISVEGPGGSQTGRRPAGF